MIYNAFSKITSMKSANIYVIFKNVKYSFCLMSFCSCCERHCAMQLKYNNEISVIYTCPVNTQKNIKL